MKASISVTLDLTGDENAALNNLLGHVTASMMKGLGLSDEEVVFIRQIYSTLPENTKP